MTRLDRRDFLRLLGGGAAAAAAGGLGCGAGRLGAPPRPLTPSHAGYAPGEAVERFRRGRRPGDRFVAGAARVRVTPPDLRGIWLAGYGFERQARGVLDPIWVRAFFFDDGATPLWLISADIIGFQYPSVRRIRDLIGPAHGQHAIIAATHNHDGPDTIGYWGPSFMYLVPVESGIDLSYLTWLERAAAVAAVRAVQTAVPARLRLARTTVPGEVINLRQPGYFDHELTVLQSVAERDGRPIGTLLFFPCHAEVLADDNHYVSADFPGFMYAAVERSQGGVAGFFQGAEGAMVTSRFDKYWPLARRYRYAQELGRACGARAVAALDAARPLPAPRIALRRRAIAYPVSTPMFRLIAKLGLPLVERSFADGSFHSEVAVAELGALTMAAIPGEPSPAIGFAARDLLRGEQRLVLGLANDEVGYILTEQQYRDPAYGYEASVSPGPEAGALTLAALRALA